MNEIFAPAVDFFKVRINLSDLSVVENKIFTKKMKKLIHPVYLAGNRGIVIKFVFISAREIRKRSLFLISAGNKLYKECDLFVRGSFWTEVDSTLAARNFPVGQC